MDVSTTVVLGGVLTSIVSTIGAVVIALINNKKERTQSASEGVEQMLRQQVKFYADRLSVLEKENERLRDEAGKGSD